MNAFTTLRRIKTWYPCLTGWHKLLVNLGKVTEDDEPLPMSVILESNGLEDAVWAVRAVAGNEHDARMLLWHMASSVSQFSNNPQLEHTLRLVKGYAVGDYTAHALAEAQFTLSRLFPVGQSGHGYFAARATMQAAEEVGGTSCYGCLRAVRNAVVANGWSRLPTLDVWMDSPQRKSILEEFIHRFCTP